MHWCLWIRNAGSSCTPCMGPKTHNKTIHQLQSRQRVVSGKAELLKFLLVLHLHYNSALFRYCRKAMNHKPLETRAYRVLTPHQPKTPASESFTQTALIKLGELNKHDLAKLLLLKHEASCCSLLFVCNYWTKSVANIARNSKSQGAWQSRETFPGLLLKFYSLSSAGSCVKLTRCQNVSTRLQAFSLSMSGNGGRQNHHGNTLCL